MIIESIFLAIIQGLTEFLPVSSSGHLSLLSYFMYIESEDLLLYFLVLHAGTACSAIYFFREDIFNILEGVWDTMCRKSTDKSKASWKWILLILTISIPTAIVGFAFKSTIESMGQSIFALGVAWAITGFVLLATKNKSYNTIELEEFTYKKAFLVGLAQSCALVPGISRSGSTIAMALLLGASPKFAGKLSFLASFVAIFGALLLEVLDYVEVGESSIPMYLLFVGFFVSFVVGLFALKFLIQLLSHGKLYLFSYYCFALAGISCVLFYLYAVAFVVGLWELLSWFSNRLGG